MVASIPVSGYTINERSRRRHITVYRPFDRWRAPPFAREVQLKKENPALLPRRGNATLVPDAPLSRTESLFKRQMVPFIRTARSWDLRPMEGCTEPRLNCACRTGATRRLTLDAPLAHTERSRRTGGPLFWQGSRNWTSALCPMVPAGA